MSESINDGGSAFPVSPVICGKSDVYTTTKTWDGMSLRDWFAGQALIGLWAGLSQSKIQNGQTREAWIRGIAEASYEMADAMIAEREKGAK